MSDSQKKVSGTSNAAMYGRVTVTLRDCATKRTLRRMESPNLIVGDGIVALLYLLTQNESGPSANGFSIKSLRLGTGATPPTDADKNLETEVYAVNLEENEKLVIPANREIVFSHLLASADGNGYKYREAALVMADASLPSYSKVFARYVHPPFTKTVDNEAQYEWHIVMRAASNQ